MRYFGKRALSLGPFVLVELVLAALVISSLWLSVMSIADNSTFWQKYYAKDNAYIAESFHAVSNGELHFGYLWKTDSYTLNLNDDKVVVARQVTGSKPNPQSKAFGKSEELRVESTSFMPQTCEWILDPSQERTLSIDQSFTPYSGCLKTSEPLSGLSISGSEVDFPAGTMQTQAQSAFNGIEDAIKARTQEDFSASGPSIRLHAIKKIETSNVIDTEKTDTTNKATPSDPQKVSLTSITIYTNNNNDVTKRLACLIGESIGQSVLNAAESSESIAAANDITIIITAQKESELAIVQGILRTAALRYLGGTPSG